MAGGQGWYPVCSGVAGSTFRDTAWLGGRGHPCSGLTQAPRRSKGVDEVRDPGQSGGELQDAVTGVLDLAGGAACRQEPQRLGPNDSAVIFQREQPERQARTGQRGDQVEPCTDTGIRTRGQSVPRRLSAP